jgi:hypothetical protein
MTEDKPDQPDFEKMAMDYDNKISGDWDKDSTAYAISIVRRKAYKLGSEEIWTTHVLPVKEENKQLREALEISERDLTLVIMERDEFWSELSKKGEPINSELLNALKEIVDKFSYALPEKFKALIERAESTPSESMPIKSLDERGLQRVSESTPLEPVKSEWISVKDKLPEFTEPLIGCNDDNTPKVIIENYHVTVLAFDPEIGIFKAKLTKFGWSEIGKSYINGTVNVTHWQPLPSPPIE